MIPYDIYDWGQRIELPDHTHGTFNADKWVIHWPGNTFSGDSAQAFRDIERYHIDFKGWKTIAYNYGISPTGVIYRLRGENQSGATSGDYEGDGIPENKEARAVLMLTEGDMTIQQQLAFTRMWNEDRLPVIGHRQVHEASGTGVITSCPGQKIINQLKTEFWMADIVIPSWLKPAWDKAIAAGFINTTDSSVDDPNSIITYGRLVALLDRIGAFDPDPVVVADESGKEALETLARIKAVIK